MGVRLKGLGQKMNQYTPSSERRTFGTIDRTSDNTRNKPQFNYLPIALEVFSTPTPVKSFQYVGTAAMPKKGRIRFYTFILLRSNGWQSIFSFVSCSEKEKLSFSKIFVYFSRPVSLILQRYKLTWCQ